MIYLFGISNCDRVVKARRILEQSGVAFEYIDFRKGNFKIEQVKEWLERASIDEIISKRSKAWGKLTEQQQADLLSDPDPQLLFENETLVKRPVLVTKDIIHLGFKQSVYDEITQP